MKTEGIINNMWEKLDKSGNPHYYVEMIEGGAEVVYSGWGNIPSDKENDIELAFKQKHVVEIVFEMKNQYKNISTIRAITKEQKPIVQFDITKAIDNLEQLLAYLKEQMK